MMKAIILQKSGGVEHLILKEIEKADAKENEVIVEVKAISINPADAKIRSAEEAIKVLYANQDPIILGWDIAGIVVGKGGNARQFEIGDCVFGMVNFLGAGNAYAEYVASPESHLAKIPANISFEDAAASTLAALTALQVLQGKVKKDDRVLIHAGSGGVGHFAIQMAKAMGAYVISTSSAKNRDFILSLGADEHIDYRTQKFEEVANDIDFVLDGMGGEVLMNSTKVMRKGGSIISLPTPPPVLEEAQKIAGEGVSVSSIMVQSNGKDMEILAKMLEDGTLKAHVSKTFAFEDMRLAHAEIESGRTVGKIVVTL